MEEEPRELHEGLTTNRPTGETYPANRTPGGTNLKKIYNMLARVPLFRDARWEDMKLEPLDSFTNLNYKVTTSDETYVLRIAGKGTSNNIDRAFKSRFDAFAIIDHYLELLRKLQAPLPRGFEEMKREMDAVRRLLEAICIPLTPCHNDLWPENFVEVGRRIYLIDWEYSGMNDPMWDLGNLSVEAGFRGEQERVMMEAYCGGFVPPRLYDRIVLYKAIGSFFWALWSIVQYANNNPATDFWTYALNRFERCKGVYAWCL